MVCSRWKKELSEPQPPQKIWKRIKNLKSAWICTGLSTDPSVLRLNKNILDTGNELTFLVDFNGVKSSFRIKRGLQVAVGGGVGLGRGFWGNIWFSGGTEGGAGVSHRQKSLKRDYRKSTADWLPMGRRRGRGSKKFIIKPSGVR